MFFFSHLIQNPTMGTYWRHRHPHSFTVVRGMAIFMRTFFGICRLLGLSWAPWIVWLIFWLIRRLSCWHGTFHKSVLASNAWGRGTLLRLLLVLFARLSDDSLNGVVALGEFDLVGNKLQTWLLWVILCSFIG